MRFLLGVMKLVKLSVVIAAKFCVCTENNTELYTLNK